LQRLAVSHILIACSLVYEGDNPDLRQSPHQDVAGFNYMFILSRHLPRGCQALIPESLKSARPRPDSWMPHGRHEHARREPYRAQQRAHAGSKFAAIAAHRLPAVGHELGVFQPAHLGRHGVRGGRGGRVPWGPRLLSLAGDSLPVRLDTQMAHCANSPLSVNFLARYAGCWAARSYQRAVRPRARFWRTTRHE